MSILERWRTVCGVLRSLRIYYGNGANRTAMDKLYGEFIKPGDLAFDIGAHVGDRTASFRRIGAHVIAVEPQPALIKLLKLLYGRDPGIEIVPAAVGARIGTLALQLNLENPTVSTASAAFIKAAGSASGWQGQSWTKTIQVPTVTLDHLIGRYGRPSFVKLDVEGFEAEALRGLTDPPPALSFEFTTIQHEVAAASIARCLELGYTRFNASLGESRTLVHANWRTGPEIERWVGNLPKEANSGDVYARLG